MVGRKQIVERIILLILVVSCMVGIFCFSNQEAAESMDLSDGLLYDIVRFLKLDISDETMLFLGFLIRKLAHFSVYAFLGFSVYLLARSYGVKDKIGILITVLICGLYAISDEIHQLFVPGRSGQISDVLLDTSGSFFGVLTAWVICAFLSRRGKND